MPWQISLRQEPAGLLRWSIPGKTIVARRCLSVRRPSTNTAAPGRRLRRRPDRAKARRGRAGARQPRGDSRSTLGLHCPRSQPVPIVALLTNAETAVRWLVREPPNLEKARPLIERIISDGRRAAGDIVSRICDFSKKALARKEVRNQRSDFGDYETDPCCDVGAWCFAEDAPTGGTAAHFGGQSPPRNR